jgi:hypothetical protein
LLAISFVAGAAVFLDWFLDLSQYWKIAVFAGMTFISGIVAFMVLHVAILALVAIVFLSIIKSPSKDEKLHLTIIVVSLLFLASADSYIFHIDIHARQTSNISKMQVTLAEWASKNLPENATIATYDVGAIGYFFYPRTVIDLYGLVTPRILHNLTRLVDQVRYLREIGCNYIMFYVEWFTGYTWALRGVGARAVELTRAHFEEGENVVCGSDNMAIYEIIW